MKKTTTRTVAAATAGVIVAATVGVGAWAAFGAGDDETSQRGTCADIAYQLSVEDDDGGLELSFELQDTAPAQTWMVVVMQGDRVVMQGERMTDEDAELDLDTPVARDGASDFTVTGTPEQGEPCVATLTR